MPTHVVDVFINTITFDVRVARTTIDITQCELLCKSEDDGEGPQFTGPPCGRRRQCNPSYIVKY